MFQLRNADIALKEYEGRIKESEDEQNDDLESSLIRLEEEQQRYIKMSYLK